MNGTLIRRLTSGAFSSVEVSGVDEEHGWIYFIAHADRARPYDTHLYRVDMEGKRFARLTGGTGRARDPALALEGAASMGTRGAGISRSARS